MPIIIDLLDMAASLSVFEIEDFKGDKFSKDKIEVPTQQNLADAGFIEEIGSPKSILKKIKESKGIISFKVTHYSETKNKPVRVFWENLEDQSFSQGSREINKGYQEIEEFYIIIDLNEKEAYFFTKKDTAISLQKRFRKAGILFLNSVKIDLSKLNDAPETNNIWGIWEDGVGRCKKKGWFGVEIDKDGQHDTSKVTTYHLEFGFGEEVIDLTISAFGRISSRSRSITNDDLIQLYRKIKQIN